MADDERVELAHKATNRSIFARGALQAAIWINNQQTGLYNMGDLLGLNDE
jgi:4-hydroxy-tetrahydrodipicolinate reductase